MGTIKTETRRKVLERDDNKCKKCDSIKRLQLHHIVPQRLQGPDEPFNLITLCAGCHTHWHALEYKLGIRNQERRNAECFYLWLKEIDKNVDELLGNCIKWKELKAIKQLLRQKKKASRGNSSAKARI